MGITLEDSFLRTNLIVLGGAIQAAKGGKQVLPTCGPMNHSNDHCGQDTLDGAIVVLLS